MPKPDPQQLMNKYANTYENVQQNGVPQAQGGVGSCPTCGHTPDAAAPDYKEQNKADIEKTFQNGTDYQQKLKDWVGLKD